MRTKMEMYERRAGDEQKAMEGHRWRVRRKFTRATLTKSHCARLKSAPLRTCWAHLPKIRNRKTVLQNKISVARKEYDLLLQGSFQALKAKRTRTANVFDVNKEGFNCSSQQQFSL